MLLFSIFRARGLGFLYQSKHFQRELSGSVGSQMDSPPFVPFNSALCLGSRGRGSGLFLESQLRIPTISLPDPKSWP